MKGNLHVRLLEGLNLEIDSAYSATFAFVNIEGVWLDAKSGVLTALQMLRTVFISFRCGILFTIFRS
jgi:hypothetical protein